jgi:hypothetical protein
MIDVASYQDTPFISSISRASVVKVVFARPHRAKRESQTWFTRGNETFNIVREGHHSGRDLKIKVGQGATRARRTRGDSIKEEGGMFGDEGCAEPAVVGNRI